jgi:protein O-GlcNAc transferase
LDITIKKTDMDSYYFSKAIFKTLKILKIPESKWNLMRRFPSLLFYPHMERTEYLLFKRLCKNKNVFLEYGSGGSTIFLLKHNKKVFSVESNPTFFRYMCSINMIKKALNVNLRYKFVDLGPTNKWGKPLSDEHCENWPRYYEEIWEEIDPARDHVDVVFIDGRFRVCCCLYSILKAVEYDWYDVVFVIHDFWRRTKYHIVLDFLEEVKSSENLVSFRIRNDIEINKVIALLEEYSLVTV